MHLYRTKKGILIESEGQYYLHPFSNWTAVINREALYPLLQEEVTALQPLPEAEQWIQQALLPPIDQQEVWAAGVTYYRSRDARVEESKDAGGGSFYERVYEAPRPELFFKATANRTVGHRQPVRIRHDSVWNVPEPELTLFVTSGAKIVGYTVGNDMSSRSIEGENPLYLPQAKTYDGSAALGPGLYIPPEPLGPETKITMQILRNDRAEFSGSIRIDRMKRSHQELVDYLYRACSFSAGCFLMTGTGIVPPDSFTLAPGDLVQIHIDGIGTLENVVSS